MGEENINLIKIYKPLMRKYIRTLKLAKFKRGRIIFPCEKAYTVGGAEFKLATDGKGIKVRWPNYYIYIEKFDCYASGMFVSLDYLADNYGEKV